jgi:hypothetical protein
MEVTLRKAASLEKSLLDIARIQPLIKNISVSVYSSADIGGEVLAAQQQLSANLKNSLALTKAAYDIREAIGSNNAQNGISALLTEKARLDAQEKLLSSVMVGATATPIDAVISIANNRRDALRERLKTAVDHYGEPADSVALNIADASVTIQFQEQLTEIRRRKIDITDQLLMLNMTKKITLTAETVALLTKFKLI